MNANTPYDAATILALCAKACGASCAVTDAHETLIRVLTAAKATEGLTVITAKNDAECLDAAVGLSARGERALAVAGRQAIGNLTEMMFSSRGVLPRAGLVVAHFDMPDTGAAFAPDMRPSLRSAGLPVLCPTHPEEIPGFLDACFTLSEKHTLPVVLCLGSDIICSPAETEFSIPPAPARSEPAAQNEMSERDRRLHVSRALAAIENHGCLALDINRLEALSGDVGIIAAGDAYLTAKSVLPDASFLRLGMLNPLPRKLIAYFASLVKRLYVIEDGEPYIEEQLRSCCIAVTGAEAFPRPAGLTAHVVAEGLQKEVGVVTGETARYEAPARFAAPVEPTPKGIRNFEEMLVSVRALPPRRVCIAGAENAAALHAGIECVELGLGAPVFVGNSDFIKETASKQYPDFKIDDYEIIDSRNEQSTAEKAVSVVREGHADILLKGGVNTPVLMRAVLNGKTGLRAGSLLSDTFVFEYPDEDGVRLVMITDGGVNLLPNIRQKIEILRNSVIVAHSLGNKLPRVAMLAASETVNPAAPSTMDAAAIMQMNRAGLIPGCVVEGPIALDVAVSRKAAAIKGTDSPVAGQADILVAANIDTANALAKSTTYFAGYRLSHIIVGGTAPILIASRSDTSDAKLLSIALGSLMAKHFEELRSGKDS